MKDPTGKYHYLIDVPVMGRYERPYIPPLRNTTVNVERVDRVWQRMKKGESFSCRLWEFPTASQLSEDQSLTAFERLNGMWDRCEELYTCTTDQKTCFDELDEMYSEHFVCNIPDSADGSAVQKAASILQRMLESSTELPDFQVVKNEVEDGGVFGPPLNINFESWDSLGVTTAMSENIIRIVLLLSAPGGISIVEAGVQHLIRFTSEMLGVVTVTSGDQAHDGSDRQRWMLLRAFLWTNWQRLVCLHMYFVLGSHLERGWYDYERESELVLRKVTPTCFFELEEVIDIQAKLWKPDYMCSWALKLLISQEACLAADFRRFNERFASIFGEKWSRCRSHKGGGVAKACDGSEPGACQRFDNAQDIENQSAHDSHCDGRCARLIGSQSSYLAREGPRAVRLLDNATPHDQCLKYCSADGKTMAVSHVWIAGMGGSTEYGLNSCLHVRFSELAGKLGCSSYWIDSACIPSEPLLRKKAIATINDVFEHCRATVVCDRDVMCIDISDCITTPEDSSIPDAHSIEVCETILTTILVCDWNVRAWTFLESSKARHNLHFLCKDKKLISFLDVVRIVHRFGSIDISILALAAPHVFPSKPKSDAHEAERALPVPGATTVPLNRASTLLGYRPARFEKDEILIWNLLTSDDKPTSDPVKFWLNKRNQNIPTGFLMSSVPRLSEPGLSWAPRTPNAARYASSMDDDPKNTYCRAYDGEGTEYAKYTFEGLRGTWGCDVIPVSKRSEGSKPRNSLVARLLARSEATKDVRPANISGWLDGCTWGLALQPLSTRSEQRDVEGNSNDVTWALGDEAGNLAYRFKPGAITGGPSYSRTGRTVGYRGNNSSPIAMVAICGTTGTFTCRDGLSCGNDHADPFSPCMQWPTWTWKGLTMWSRQADFFEHEVLIA